MENQHREIKGYRELSEEEIETMNTVKMAGVPLGLMIESCEKSPQLDQRWVAIVKTHFQQGLMALTRAIAKPTFFSPLLLVVLSGCSSGFQETAFRDESGTYIVSRSLVNDRVTANQPHVSGVFACDAKLSSEQMVELRKDGNEHSWYSTCQPIERYRPGAYQMTSDQPLATQYQGPVSAVVLGAGVGTGLVLSSDSVTQSGGGASANARAKAGKGHRR